MPNRKSKQKTKQTSFALIPTATTTTAATTATKPTNSAYIGNSGYVINDGSKPSKSAATTEVLFVVAHQKRLVKTKQTSCGVFFYQE